MPWSDHSLVKQWFGLNLEGLFSCQFPCLGGWFCTIGSPQEQAGDLGSGYKIVNHFTAIHT